MIHTSRLKLRLLSDPRAHAGKRCDFSHDIGGALRKACEYVVTRCSAVSDSKKINVLTTFFQLVIHRRITVKCCTTIFTGSPEGPNIIYQTEHVDTANTKALLTASHFLMFIVSKMYELLIPPRLFIVNKNVKFHFHFIDSNETSCCHTGNNPFLIWVCVLHLIAFEIGFRHN